MDPNAKKTALRMIPYGLYVLTAQGKDGSIAAATVNWVTQASFAPPLVVVGVKADSGAHAVIKDAGAFALNILGKGHQAAAFAFFKPAHREGDRLNERTAARIGAGLHRMQAGGHAGARRPLDLRRRSGRRRRRARDQRTYR